MSYLNSTGWRESMQTVAGKINAAFGEPVLLIPCDKQPNMQAQPQREHAVSLVAVFSWRSALALKTGNLAMNRGEGGGLVETRDPIATFARADLPFAIDHGDQIERCCDGALFEVKHTEPDGVSKVVCKLCQLGAPSQ
jgi:hypothetical protein